MNNKRRKRFLVAVLIVEVMVVGLILARVAALFCCVPSFVPPTLIVLNTQVADSTVEPKNKNSQTIQLMPSQTPAKPTEIVFTVTNTLASYTPTISPTATPSRTPTQTIALTQQFITRTSTPFQVATKEPTKNLPTARIVLSTPQSIVELRPTVPIPTALSVIVPIPTALPTTMPMPTAAPTQLPPTAELVTNTPVPSLTPIPPSPTLSNECNWGWATQPLPEITSAAQDAIINAGLDTTIVRSLAFGENCYQLYTSKILFFSTMYTDFYLNTPVADLNDLDGLAGFVKLAYQTLSTLNITLPARPGELDITFTAGGESKHFRAMFDDIRPLIEASKSSAELLAAGWLH